MCSSVIGHCKCRMDTEMSPQSPQCFLYNACLPRSCNIDPRPSFSSILSSQLAPASQHKCLSVIHAHSYEILRWTFIKTSHNLEASGTCSCLSRFVAWLLRNSRWHIPSHLMVSPPDGQKGDDDLQVSEYSKHLSFLLRSRVETTDMTWTTYVNATLINY